MKFRAEIDIMPQDALLDPQGKAVSSALKNIGLSEINDVRIGRHIRLLIESADKESAQAYTFRTYALQSKWNNTTKETDKAKSTVQLASSFTISQNPLSKAGKKSIYLQIINPDGKVLQANSGNTVDTEQGNVAYSDKKDIDYQNQAIDMSIFYDFKSTKAIKGNYKIKIICDGVVIGTDSITLK